MKRKRIISVIVVFAIIELVAVFIGVWSFIFKEPGNVSPEIRIGICPEVSKEACREKWSIFFERFKDARRYRLVPYYANSCEEAVKGFMYGSLDMLYINAAIFVRLKRDYQAKALVFHKMSQTEADYYRAALVAQKQFEFINQTRNCRLTFIDKNSMAGYIVPHKYLRNKIGGDLNKWFSRIDYSMTEMQGFDMLKSAETDLLAVDLLFLQEYFEKEGKADRKYKIIWVSDQLPEPVICVSKKSKYYNSPFLKDFQDRLFRIYRQRVRFNKLSLLFEPVNYDYNNRLLKLEKFLYEDNNKRSPRSILMKSKK